MRRQNLVERVTQDYKVTAEQLLAAQKPDWGEEPVPEDREAIESLPMYPEGRKCRHPTARRLIDLFEDVQRHTLQVGRRPQVVFATQLSRLQRRVLRLLGMSKIYDA